jgi:hypothetical protein|tara:strand:+ start:1535 stop:1780 length:246 start_codon:yes stop_codon:yes gene_type:complete
MNNNITLNKKDGTTEEMTQEAFSRWACLVEGIQAVDQKLVDAKIPDSDTKWVKPLAFEKYIQERYHSMLRDVEVEHQLGNI